MYPIVIIPLKSTYHLVFILLKIIHVLHKLDLYLVELCFSFTGCGNLHLVLQDIQLYTVKGHFS